MLLLTDYGERPIQPPRSRQHGYEIGAVLVT